MKYGALQDFECVGDDLKAHPGCGPGFPKGLRAKPGETVMFAFIIYKSRTHRDAVNAKVIVEGSDSIQRVHLPLALE